MLVFSLSTCWDHLLFLPKTWNIYRNMKEWVMISLGQSQKGEVKAAGRSYKVACIPCCYDVRLRGHGEHPGVLLDAINHVLLIFSLVPLLPVVLSCNNCSILQYISQATYDLPSIFIFFTTFWNGQKLKFNLFSGVSVVPLFIEMGLMCSPS